MFRLSIADATLTIAFLLAPLATAQPADPMSRAEFDVLMNEISNWGRWGDDDELGTLNLITDALRVEAAQQVTEGYPVSLSLPANKERGALNANPFEHSLSISSFGGHEVA